jgi:hypothetical protein
VLHTQHATCHDGPHLCTVNTHTHTNRSSSQTYLTQPSHIIVRTQVNICYLLWEESFQCKLTSLSLTTASSHLLTRTELDSILFTAAFILLAPNSSPLVVVYVSSSVEEKAVNVILPRQTKSFDVSFELCHDRLSTQYKQNRNTSAREGIRTPHGLAMSSNFRVTQYQSQRRSPWFRNVPSGSRVPGR